MDKPYGPAPRIAMSTLSLIRSPPPDSLFHPTDLKYGITVLVFRHEVRAFSDRNLLIRKSILVGLQRPGTHRFCAKHVFCAESCRLPEGRSQRSVLHQAVHRSRECAGVGVRYRQSSDTIE